MSSKDADVEQATETSPLLEKQGTPRTRALETFLNAQGDEAGLEENRLLVGGILRPDTIKALQTFLNSHWDKAGFRAEPLTVDGRFDSSTIKSLQKFLGGVQDSVSHQNCSEQTTCDDIILAEQSTCSDCSEDSDPWFSEQSTSAVDSLGAAREQKKHSSLLSSRHEHSQIDSAAPVLRSALKKNTKPKEGGALGFLKRIGSNGSLQSLGDSRRCSFAESAVVEDTPEWYVNFVSELSKPDWRKMAEAEIGIIHAEEVVRPGGAVKILGTMLSKNVWYYLVEKPSERKAGFEVVMRSYEDFVKLSQAVAPHLGHTKLPKSEPKSEWLRFPRMFNEEKHVEERLDAIQKSLECILADKALAQNKDVVHFMRPRYLTKFRPTILKTASADDLNLYL